RRRFSPLTPLPPSSTWVTRLPSAPQLADDPPNQPDHRRARRGRVAELVECLDVDHDLILLIESLLAGQRFGQHEFVPESPLGYARAYYELQLGCNYDCEHCYLGMKKFEGLSWPDRKRLLYIMRDAGVLWLQLTGGEPMVDRLFTQVYTLAYDLGMMLTILSN